MVDHLHYDQEFDAFRVAMSYFLSAMAAHCAVAILDHERWRDHSIAYDVARHCRFPLFWAALAGNALVHINNCCTCIAVTIMSKRGSSHTTWTHAYATTAAYCALYYQLAEEASGRCTS
jgi:hypothetical protein